MGIEFTVLSLKNLLKHQLSSGLHRQTIEYLPQESMPREHKLLTAGEFAEGRLGGSAVTGWYDFNGANGRKAFQDAGCDIGEFSSKFSNVDQEFFSLLSSRYFRGAIPPMTAQLVSRAYAIASKYGGGGPSDPYRDDFMKSLFVLQIVSSSSAFGVVR